MILKISRNAPPSPAGGASPGITGPAPSKPRNALVVPVPRASSASPGPPCSVNKGKPWRFFRRFRDYPLCRHAATGFSSRPDGSGKEVNGRTAENKRPQGRAGAAVVKHEHRCGAEIHVMSERIAFGQGAAADGMRQVFRDSRYQEVQFCPGCGVPLGQAMQDHELRCIDESMDYA